MADNFCNWPNWIAQKQINGRRYFLNFILQVSVLTSIADLVPVSAQGANKEINTNAENFIVNQIESYLNSVKTLSAEFLQIDAKGNSSKGYIHLRRPGRLRFEYDAPSPLLLVADGIWMILYDKELEQVSRFPLYQTPLGVLLDDPVNLRETVKVIFLEKSRGILRIKLIERDEPDKGWLGITFSEPPILLRQWEIKDAQGGITSVSLTNITVNHKLDPELFVFNDPIPSSE